MNWSKSYMLAVRFLKFWIFLIILNYEKGPNQWAQNIYIYSYI